MKLRTYIVLMSIGVVTALLSFFSYQSKSILNAGFGKLNAVHISNISSVAKSLVDSKRVYLQGFSRMLESDTDLSGAYVLAKESKDYRFVKQKLSQIQARTDFDVVDLISKKGMALRNQELSMRDAAILETIRFRRGILTIGEGSKLTLIAISPLRLYDETVGYVLLGYDLNHLIKKEMESIGNARLKFHLPEGKHIPEESKAISKELGLYNEGGLPVLLRIETMNSFVGEVDKIVTKSLFYFGLFSILVLFVLIYFLLDFGFVRRFKALLANIENAADALSTGTLPSMKISYEPIREVELLAKSFSKFSQSIIAYNSFSKEQERIAAEAKEQAAVAEIAEHVVHDIRSPLAALDMFAVSLSEVKEESRIALRGAIQRIRDIVNDLSKKGAKTKVNATSHKSVHLLSSVVDEIVTEKRLQYARNSEICIESEIGSHSYGLFGNIEIGELKRALSNIIDNSVEAISDRGKIRITIKSKDGFSQIEVSDNGRGIPEERLNVIGERNRSFDKECGSGLGIFYARTILEKWGGKLHIESTPKKGTRVTFLIPQASTPEWFVPELKIPSLGTVVVLDDDSSIHSIWKNRFLSLNKKSNAMRLLQFSTAEELVNFVSSAPSNIVYLCDYELRGEALTGLDLIEKLGIKEKAILVTSHYEEEAIRARCFKMDVKLIPKGLAGFVPISIV